MRKPYTVIKIILAIFVLVSNANAQTATPTDYLILQSIGGYHSSGKGKCGNGAGFLEAADHFGENHSDITCRTGYYNTAQDLAISVQVSQHPGFDSDQWLAHEVEGLYRNNPVTDKYRGVLRVVNRNRIFTYVRGTQYSWFSNNIVVNIEYTDLQKTKAEPVDVITAYLQKHPSTIPAMVMDSAHDVQWIKDEMTRRLWLCDKWVLQIQTPDPKLYDKLKSITDSISVFLNYREKYYGMASANDKNLLSGYLGQKNDPAIRAKLAEYKTWWTAHKNDAITLP